MLFRHFFSGTFCAWAVFILLTSNTLKAQTVTNVTADCKHGQVFIRWTNIPATDSGFYYVYKSSQSIDDSNDFKASQYLGRIPFNFGTDDRFTKVMNDGTTYYLIYDDETSIGADENLFVHTATVDGEKFYYAVRCDYGHTVANWEVNAGMNTTLTKVKEVAGPVKCYLQAADVVYPDAPPGERMDIYVHYGTNASTDAYPSMTNEGCLPFHFGIVKTGELGGGNAVFLKFHGGGGDFFTNAITSHIDDSWKISFDDWLPAFGFDPNGVNTRWLGYVESLDIYKSGVTTLPPSTGIVRGYTLARVNWELEWILNKWNSVSGITLDTNRMYLVGTSQGCAAVLLLSVTTPWRFAAGNMTVPKFDLTAPDDSNPDCKFNEGGSSLKQTRVFFGDENVSNLQTDISILPGGNTQFRIYDLSNCNYTFSLRKNASLPFLSAINGKNDVNTCWQEKIGFYGTVQSTHTGGVWMWDLREHNGSAGASWNSFDAGALTRFSLLRSYPAFSNTSLDNDPGSSFIPEPPYYSGDDVGALHAAIDWMDSSIIDTTYMYQVRLFAYQSKLINETLFPERLPESAIADVTIRRPQQFKNFQQGTSLCWMNFYHGKLIQSGTIHQLYEDGVPVPLTVHKVKVFPDGSLFRIMRCDSIQPTGALPSVEDSDSDFASCTTAEHELLFAKVGIDVAQHPMNGALQNKACDSVHQVAQIRQTEIHSFRHEAVASQVAGR